MDGDRVNKVWRLNEQGEPFSRDATQDELDSARAIARLKLEKADYAMRSCWSCNPAHAHFLEDLNDKFLFVCFDCGGWFYQGVEITQHDTE